MNSEKERAISEARVVAVTATYRRAPELRRLLASLEASGAPLHALIIVDNAGDAETRALAETARVRTDYVNPGSNLGCGGGLKAGETLALEKYGAILTHLWILDDDAEIAPDTLATLLRAMLDEDADAAHPLVTDAEGRVGWIPGFLDRKLLRAAQRPQTPDDFLARAGSATIPFSWAQGIALLVTRRALDRQGFHRDDFWVRGEDLEFSLRITHRGKGICVPAARVAHLPPAPSGPVSTEAEYAKHRAMLQNIAYIAVRLPHGRSIARTIPGNWLRFLRAWRWQPRAWLDGWIAFWRGAALGRPAGVK